MGKYMRKAKASGEVAVMEVPGGVRTRSRTLALQRAQRPLRDKGEAGADYLELRSRRLEKPPHPPALRRSVGQKGSAAAAAPAQDAAAEVSFGENVLDLDAMDSCRSTRETTPCSLIRNSETISAPGSTTKNKTNSSMTSSRRVEASVCRFIPTSFEIEEFFAAAEQHEQKTFREKYNFCTVNDCPLPGRYEWTRLEC